MTNKLVLVHTAPATQQAPNPRATHNEDPWADDKGRQLGMLQQAATRAAECLLDILHPDNFSRYTPVEQAQIALNVLDKTGATKRMRAHDDRFAAAPVSDPRATEKRIQLGATLRDLSAKLPYPELVKKEVNPE